MTRLTEQEALSLLIEAVEEDHAVYASGAEAVARWKRLRAFAFDAVAAEERGRRRGVEERDELRAALIASRPFVADHYKQHALGINAKYHLDLLNRIDAALAPRAQASDWPPCATCNHEKFWHQWSSKAHAFCCSPVGGDYCGCKNYLAPRDSGKLPTHNERAAVHTDKCRAGEYDTECK